MFQSILVPIDGSQHAKTALSVACRLLSQPQGTLWLVHVPEPLVYETTLVWDIGPVTLETSQEEWERIGQRVLARAAETARAEGVSRIETDIVQGEPTRAILGEARRRGAEAIVMGSRGLSDLSGIVVGSVSHKVAHTADCAVITVRSAHAEADRDQD
ncbi:universal stress protein [Halomonas campisalis]|uniref:Universal stress protein n=1 Tax=Billgrantia campisalis TaxID=74661 RepID=A0ABS9P6L1_9GAMM|nr:universal stress protein [Halomonas campisalis]MCG6657398.1 universal stress protein [Halomonas campisalis]MDR5863257.1 universal stress protein [Halomonas campisalis]